MIKIAFQAQNFPFQPTYRAKVPVADPSPFISLKFKLYQKCDQIREEISKERPSILFKIHSRSTGLIVPLRDRPVFSFTFHLTMQTVQLQVK